MTEREQLRKGDKGQTLESGIFDLEERVDFMIRNSGFDILRH